MIGKRDSISDVFEEDSTSAHENVPKTSTRRRFLGQVGVAAIAAGALAIPPVVSAEASGSSTGSGSTSTGSSSATGGGAAPPGPSRIKQAFALRSNAATQDSNVVAAINVNNGDDGRYADEGGTYTKGLPHDKYGRVDLAAYAALKTALASGKFSDFEAIPLGGTRSQTGPQGGLAYDLEALDNVQFGQPQVPAAPPIAGDLTATELVELYWASLLRDVAFTDYISNPIAIAAATELSTLSTYQGPTIEGQVTPDLLFRGGFPGETMGPYISQFFITPTFLGAQPISQQMVSYLPGIDYMTSFGDWLTVQSGNVTGAQNQIDPQLRYRRLGRDLAAFTHVDVLYQAYFTAFLVLSSIGAPLNPGNPYFTSTAESGFGTFGPPDFAGTLGEVATRALNAVWYQKWFVHLRPRPEATGGQVYLIQTGQGSQTDVQPSKVILDSMALEQSFNTNNSWLLSQAFPEGSPTHPSYPTGHGTVAGACITLLKFFFDGTFVLQQPMQPSSDGLSLLPFAPSAVLLTVNGELNKLGHNVTFGHGIHAGIHWRSDSDTSMLLGEAVALNFLSERAQTYNEPFSVSLTKFDGTTATIFNAGNP
jgi:hypothetical protein